MGCGASKDNKKTAELDRELKVDRLRSLLNLKLLLLGTLVGKKDAMARIGSITAQAIQDGVLDRTC